MSQLEKCFTVKKRGHSQKNALQLEKCNKRLNAGEPHNVEQNNLATLFSDLLQKFTYQTSLEVYMNTYIHFVIFSVNKTNQKARPVLKQGELKL